ncbi:MAG: gamma-glutamyl-gamma-aminobutyrate hydrolase family protein [Actinomycetota bacterium]|nr:gamma-glutamyl-gamma-aminobutyrate hydrolase family protein [Actinomycetota bacterium]
MAPLVGITGRTSLGAVLAPGAAHLADSPVDWFFGEYGRRIREAGGLPAELPIIDDPMAYVERLDALLLTGGGDVNPERWQGPDDGAFMVSKERDEFEFSLLKAALDAELPVLGICRGLQVINVFLGGTLIPHLDWAEGDGHSKRTEDRTERRHRVACEAGSTLHELYGPTMMVNSFHHQAVDQLGEQLQITARSDDGTVEGIEHLDADVLGVQWHPEMLAELEPIFGWLVGVALK